MLLAVVSACGSPSSQGSTTSHEFGHYSGGTADTSLTLSFDASGSGITNMQGQAVMTCGGIGGSSMPSLPFNIATAIPLDGGGQFSTDTTTQLPNGDGTIDIKVAGTLDSTGHASGTFSETFANDTCDSGGTPMAWTATNGSAASPSSSSGGTCSPQPCGSAEGVSMAVSSLTNIYPASDNSPDSLNLVELQFVVSNNSSSSLVIADEGLQIQAGSGQAVMESNPEGDLPSGASCTYEADVPSGAHSDTLTTCFQLTNAQLSQPLKLLWSLDTDQLPSRPSGTIDLSPLTIGSSLP